MVLLPKFLGILPFDQANKGAHEAAKELQNPRSSVRRTDAENSVAGQIEIMTNAPTQGMEGVMLSNNSGDQIVPAAEAAQASRHQGRDLGLADPVGQGRERLRRAGRLRLDRHGDGRHGPRSSAPTAASSPSSRRRLMRPTRTPGSRPCRRR